MKRRTFLQFSACLWAAYGCSPSEKSAATKSAQWIHCQAKDGKTLGDQTLSLPDLAQLSRVGGSRDGLFLGAKNSLVAISAQGSLVTLQGHSEGLWVDSKSLVTGQKISAEEYRLSGVELPGGRSLWQVVVGYSTLLGVQQGVVYVATPSGITAYSCESGQKIWTNPDLRDLNAHHLGPQALVVSAANSGVVHWLDLSNGKSLRQVKTNDKSMRVVVLVSDGEVTLALTRRIAVSGYNSKSNKPIWTTPLSPDEHDSELVAYQDGIALVRIDSETQAIQLQTGKLLWKAPLSLQAVPVSQGVALFTQARSELGDTGENPRFLLEAREMSSGKKLWSRVCQGTPTATIASDDGFLILSPEVQEVTLP